MFKFKKKVSYDKLVPSDFVAEVYLDMHPDVAIAGADPFRHYVEHGKKEGRAYQRLEPTSHKNATAPARQQYDDFKNLIVDLEIEVDDKWYLEEYPELAESNLTPYQHYSQIGIFEGRHPKFDGEWYLSEYEDVKRSNADPLRHYIEFGRAECRHPGFNSTWYYIEYPDVRFAGIDPRKHYKLTGKKEGRAPSFNPHWYKQRYEDVTSAGIDVFSHYMTNGRGEGRIPAFSSNWYLKEYPDAESSNLGAYAHYVKYGKAASYKPAPHRDFILQNSPRLTAFPPSYDAHYEPRARFENLSTDIKAIAFYLPQFHESEENNRWWGPGFTEWTNTKSAKPRFNGHYQPRTPHADIGYYDLTQATAWRRQAEDAAKHGIYGFCVYHYWFSGKRLLSKPLDVLLEHPDIDIKFCLCWANENWTRTWDGQEHDILIQQEYSNEDPEKFISDAERYFLDPRYIKVDGSPVIIVYKPHIIPNVGDVFAAWKYEWMKRTGQNLIIWCNRTESSDYAVRNLDAEFDAVVEFPPHMVPHTAHVSKYKLEPQFIGTADAGNYYDYRRVVDDIINGSDYAPKPQLPFYRGVTLGWDNSARRATGQSIWYGFSLSYYYKWLTHIINYTRQTFQSDRRFIFINAWNEWAEGTYLEPDAATGYANLNTTTKAILGLPYKDDLVVLPTDKAHVTLDNKRIAVHLHVFYLDQLQQFCDLFSVIKFDFDLYVTTDGADKAEVVREKVNASLPNIRLTVVEVANIGRDIGPMLLKLRKQLLSYDYFAHLHTKKSLTVEWGDRWRDFLIGNLVGSTEHVASLIGIFESDDSIGLLYPPTYPLIAPHVSWGDVKNRCEDLLDKLGCSTLLPEIPQFPVGNMFWAKVSAVAPILEYNWQDVDFEIEEDQVAGTLPHCIERLWGYVAASRGYRFNEVFSLQSPQTFSSQLKSLHNGRKRLVLFVHYNSNLIVSDADMYLLRSLREVSSFICVVSNSAISDDAAARICLYADDIFIRDNNGYDFAAWKAAIDRLGWDFIAQFEEIAFVNNSCYGPLYPLSEVFSAMEGSKADFWGITSFPNEKNSQRPEASLLENCHIMPHLQSYFLVMRQSVIQSSQFYRFWNSVEEKEGFMDVVTSYEIGLTDKLSKAGFKWECYIPEASEIQRSMKHDPHFNAPYNMPYDLLLMRSPFIKKKAWHYSSSEVIRSRKLVDKLGYYPAHLIWQ
ncbi:glycoside hydrolase family 99-like domain-containing protein [Methylorubrum rhodesianum]|uniref:glycoside hydrolase family 99-like domain-containing protein n=1 Tax=Methylorubrum rhodesianum TaxID=29427 RepID=UPI003746ACEA